jgi:hypothetical protein
MALHVSAPWRNPERDENERKLALWVLYTVKYGSYLQLIKFYKKVFPKIFYSTSTMKKSVTNFTLSKAHLCACVRVCACVWGQAVT